MTSDLRIGFGVDYHQIQKGNSMILGGIEIDCGYSIIAHSDGDIILHSICDALLGAASMGDLGTVFTEDESTENISSSVLLNQVLMMKSLVFRYSQRISLFYNFYFLLNLIFFQIFLYQYENYYQIF